jgi:hypothetical protein
LTTFDYQAKDFYMKQGYEIFGVLENCPPNHNLYFLRKRFRGRGIDIHLHLLNEGKSISDIASTFNVHNATIYRLLNKEDN